MAMGISSPYLKAVRGEPGKTKRVRDIKSAKPGGGVVIIEREATSVPRPRVSVRARSAYICEYAYAKKRMNIVDNGAGFWLHS